MQNPIRKLSMRRIALVVLVVMVAAIGWLAADTATRPLDVQLRTHVRICQRAADGSWKLVDEAGPASLSFQASLWELSSSRRASSDFVWSTRTKNGHNYSVRLAEQANLGWNPASGQFDGDLPFEVTWDGKKARVAGRLTTESVPSPLGSLSGKRAAGVLGRGVITFTLVSSNDLRFPGEAPMKLVCTEEYRLTPK